MISVLLPSKQEPKVLEVMMILEEMLPDVQIIIANDRYGMGKGWAMREALSQAQYDVVCFLDADMDIHPKMIWRLMPFLDDYDIVVGKKQVRGFLSRRILTRLSRLYIWILFGLNLDTQTGIKLFRRDAIMPWLSNSFAFDIEILSNAKKAGFDIIEVPVETSTTKKMNIKSIFKCLIESFKIKLREFV